MSVHLKDSSKHIKQIASLLPEVSGLSYSYTLDSA